MLLSSNKIVNCFREIEVILIRGLIFDCFRFLSRVIIIIYVYKSKPRHDFPLKKTFLLFWLPLQQQNFLVSIWAIPLLPKTKYNLANFNTLYYFLWFLMTLRLHDIGVFNREKSLRGKQRFTVKVMYNLLVDSEQVETSWVGNSQNEKFHRLKCIKICKICAFVLF